VADQLEVPDVLDAHDPGQLAVDLVAPEHDPGGDLGIELVRGHVRLVPAIGRDHAVIGLGGGVDDREDRLAFVVPAGTDVSHAGYSTVTVFARFRGWSTFRPRARAMW
jgi:hypothetical protein